MGIAVPLTITYSLTRRFLLMNELEKLLEFNRYFVASKKYTHYITDKYPNRNIAILACMDSRMMELLYTALGLKNGDAKVIKNAGATVTHPFGSVMRSLIVAIYQLRVKEILVIGHTDCGMQGLNAEDIFNKAKEAGISEDSLNMLKNAGIDIEQWLAGFASVEESVEHSVNLIKKHPMMPDYVQIHGLLMDSKTGELTPSLTFKPRQMGESNLLAQKPM